MYRVDPLKLIKLTLAIFFTVLQGSPHDFWSTTVSSDSKAQLKMKIEWLPMHLYAIKSLSEVVGIPCGTWCRNKNIPCAVHHAVVPSSFLEHLCKRNAFLWVSNFCRIVIVCFITSVEKRWEVDWRCVSRAPKEEGERKEALWIEFVCVSSS